MSDPPPRSPEVTRTRAWAGVAGGGAVVGGLGAGVLTDFPPQMELDGAVSEAVYVGDDRAPALNWLLEALTAPGGAIFRLVVFLAVLVWLVRRRAWPVAAWVLTAVVVIGPLTTLLKESFGRIRPDFDAGGARLDSLSYPSGHASGIATLVTVALLLAWPVLSPRARRIWLAVGVAAVVLVGATRMWLGVHYLSDVIGGWALGIAWSLLVALAFGALPGGRRALPARQGRPVSSGMSP
ncbi:MAG: phosphatase PAP2 family protein [Actinomycetes bacterium]